MPDTEFRAEPKGCLVIEAVVSGEVRTYELHRPQLKNGYRSRVSGGQLHWTDQGQGPNGEPITETREWVLLTGEGALIGSFARWDGPYSVSEFFLHFLRPQILDMLEIPA